MSETVKAPSKSKRIAAVLKEKGIDTPASDVLRAAGLEDSKGNVALVNNVKHRIRHEKGEKKVTRRGRRRRSEASAAPVASPIQNEFDQMLAVKNFASTVGGLDNLSNLVNKMAQLAG